MSFVGNRSVALMGNFFAGFLEKSKARLKSIVQVRGAVPRLRYAATNASGPVPDDQGIHARCCSAGAALRYVVCLLAFPYYWCHVSGTQLWISYVEEL